MLMLNSLPFLRKTSRPVGNTSSVVLEKKRKGALVDARERRRRSRFSLKLVEPLSRELSTYAYRIVGGYQDAEDALQETRSSRPGGISDLASRPRASARGCTASRRTRCLDMVRQRQRRVLPQDVQDSPVAPGPPTYRDPRGHLVARAPTRTRSCRRRRAQRRHCGCASRAFASRSCAPCRCSRRASVRPSSFTTCSTSRSATRRLDAQHHGPGDQQRAPARARVDQAGDERLRGGRGARALTSASRRGRPRRSRASSALGRRATSGNSSPC